MRMHVFGFLLAALWITFVVTWIVAAFDTKRYAQRNVRSIVARVSALLIVLSLLRIHAIRHALVGVQHAVRNPLLASIGIVLVALGIGVAIWARIHLGRNWGMPMSLKEDPELVTSGPYAMVRHPIYGGMLVAMFGSMLVSILWFVPLVLFGFYFFWSAKTEEKIMLKQFPQSYPDYMTRTKMFFPSVF
jgi:protein-S-isoprenylcysteine O-methyltransferase Ste14